MSETFEQWFEKRMTSPDEWEQAKTYDWLKDCWHARDAEIQALRDQIANASKEIERLKRPEMVRELPEVMAFLDAFDPLDRAVMLLSRCDKCGDNLCPTHERRLKASLKDFLEVLWSAKPIEPDAVPEGGE